MSNRGSPIVGLRTATHAFDIKSSPTYRRYSWNSKEWDGGFGRQVLGETWITHHGKHKVQSTRAVFAAGQASHPVLRGIQRRRDLGANRCLRGPAAAARGDAPLVLGQVLEGMKPTDAPAGGAATIR